MKIFVSILLFVCSYSLQAQVYESNIQQIVDLDVINVPDNYGKRIISIKNDSYSIMLPDNTFLTGTLKFEKDFINQKGYKYTHYVLDNGGKLVIGDKDITLSLTDTHNKIITYLLKDKLRDDLYMAKKQHQQDVQELTTEVEKLRLEVQATLINAEKHKYDEFTQKCLDDRQVRIGMDGKAASLLLDEKIRVQTTETTAGITEVQTYKNHIIHVTNGKVDAISKIE